MTHGILARILSLSPESAREFRSIVKSYVNSPSLNPVDAYQEVIVGKIAWNDWIFLRIVESAVASISLQTQFREHDECAEQVETAYRLVDGIPLTPGASLTAGGLYGQDRNVHAVRKAIGLLQRLRDLVMSRGFNVDVGVKILHIVYGSYHPLQTAYQVCRDAALAPENERAEQGIPQPDTCVEYFLSNLDLEIRRLQGLEKTASFIEPMRLETDVRCGQISEAVFELLDRYKTSGERSNDRLLKHLRQLQQRGRGKRP